MNAAPAMRAVVLAGLILALGRAGDDNARWNFLRTNLQVFPGTEKLFEPDDRLFWRLKAGLSKVRAAEQLPDKRYPFRVSTDAHGRRKTPETSPQGPTALFLGDSCTFGIPVDDAEAFPARVGDLLGVKALNAGVPGYSAFQGRVLLDSLAERPRAVVISFWVNGRTSWDHLSDAEHVELLAAERSGEFSKHRVTRLLRRVTPGVRPRLSDEEFAGELRRMIVRSREIGAEPVLLIWPTIDQMSGGAEHERQRIIRGTGRETGAKVVDLAESFRVSGGERLFVDPVHATAEGYRVAAAVVAEALQPILAPK